MFRLAFDNVHVQTSFVSLGVIFTGYLDKDFFCENCTTYNSHCSHHSTESVAFSLTEVWYFSFPKPIVTKASLVPAKIRENELKLRSSFTFMTSPKAQFLYTDILLFGSKILHSPSLPLIFKPLAFFTETEKMNYFGICTGCPKKSVFFER